MKGTIHSKTTRAELASLVCQALAADLKDEPVLVGGAVVSIYTRGRYVSNDLDLVTRREPRLLAPVMKRLGFVRRGSHWEHPKSPFTVQFVSWPVMIGTKHVSAPERVSTSVGDLPTLSPLDSACDRLAWFLSGDVQSLDQCVDVIVSQKVPMTAVREWLERQEWPASLRTRAAKTLERRLALARSRRRH